MVTTKPGGTGSFARVSLQRLTALPPTSASAGRPPASLPTPKKRMWGRSQPAVGSAALIAMASFALAQIRPFFAVAK